MRPVFLICLLFSTSCLPALYPSSTSPSTGEKDTLKTPDGEEITKEFCTEEKKTYWRLKAEWSRVSAESHDEEADLSKALAESARLLSDQDDSLRQKSLRLLERNDALVQEDLRLLTALQSVRSTARAIELTKQRIQITQDLIPITRERITITKDIIRSSEGSSDSETAPLLSDLSEKRGENSTLMAQISRLTARAFDFSLKACDLLTQDHILNRNGKALARRVTSLMEEDSNLFTDYQEKMEQFNNKIKTEQTADTVRSEITILTNIININTKKLEIRKQIRELHESILEEGFSSPEESAKERENPENSEEGREEPEEGEKPENSESED